MKINTLKEGFEKYNLIYTEEMEEKFLKFKELLLEWNKKINITRIEDEEEIYIKHYLDSIILLKDGYIDNFKGKKIIDVGTGGGFPGLPMKIVEDSLDVTLLDSLRKRMDFLDLVIENLELDNIRTIHGRAEDFGKDKIHREKYDFCVSRAVAQLNVLAEYCLPFVKVGGYFIAMKSNISQEIENAEKAIELLGGQIEKIEDVSLPNSDISRKIIYIKKVSATDKKYPRKAGTPSKKPLI